MVASTKMREMPRAARTRAALVQAGQALFAARPVDSVAIDEIVALAGVAKGSFFNHFRDKQHFASAIAADIRITLERQVEAENAGKDDPVDRLAGGMFVAACFALAERERTQVMIRGTSHLTPGHHPLNDGLHEDLYAAAQAGLLSSEAQNSGLMLWLAACHILMLEIVERHSARTFAASRLQDVMAMALIGLGIPAPRSRETAARHAARMRAGAD